MYTSGPSLQLGAIQDINSELASPIPPVIDNDLLASLPLSGQIDGIPGGGASNGAIFGSDPSGISAIAIDPVIPSPSGSAKQGGWMQVASGLLQGATQAFKAYNAGSPTVGVPPARGPSSSIVAKTAVQLPFSSTSLVLIGVGVIAAIAIVHFA